MEGSHQYAVALLETIQAIREICRRFYEKSQGHIGQYAMAEYNADLKIYEGLVNKCQEAGIALNRRIHNASGTPDG